VSIFKVEDLTAGQNEQVKATTTKYHGAKVEELNLQRSSDGYQITANSSTSDVAILTGSGNDTIYALSPTGMTFIDAGTGTNTIVGGLGDMNITIQGGSPNPPFASDTISNFHAGDELTFTGETSLYVTVRGNNTVYDAFNPLVPGSAVYATFVNLPSSLTVGHSSAGITLTA
jgi:hypothetical protein